MKRSHLNIILSMFAVFGSGIVVGAFGYHSYTAKTVTATVGGAPVKRDSPEEWRRKYIAEIRSRLQLSEPQVTTLNSILDETRQRFKNLKERHKLETEQVKGEQTDKIRAMLTPTQLPEYVKFREERDRKMKEQAAKEQANKK